MFCGGGWKPEPPDGAPPAALDAASAASVPVDVPVGAVAALLGASAALALVAPFWAATPCVVLSGVKAARAVSALPAAGRLLPAVVAAVSLAGVPESWNDTLRPSDGMPAWSSARFSAGWSCCKRASVSGRSALTCTVLWPVASLVTLICTRPSSAGCNCTVTTLDVPLALKATMADANCAAGEETGDVVVAASKPVAVGAPDVAFVASVGGESGVVCPAVPASVASVAGEPGLAAAPRVTPTAVWAWGCEAAAAPGDDAVEAGFAAVSATVAVARPAGSGVFVTAGTCWDTPDASSGAGPATGAAPGAGIAAVSVAAVDVWVCDGTGPDADGSAVPVVAA